MIGDERFSSLSEEELIRQAKEDANAFGYLYELHVDKIYNYIFYKTFNHELAEDLTHDVFERTLENIKKYENRGISFAGWIFRIARNRVIDYYRKRKELPLNEEPQGDENHLNDFIHEEEKKNLLVAVAALNEQQREVINLRYQEGLSHAEIGLIVGKSEGAVKALVYRGIENIRRIFNDTNNSGK